jgi:ribosomal protein S18 acetylase RimI-like enzyme
VAIEPAATAEDARAAAALDANFAELLAWYGSGPGGDVRHDPDLQLSASGVAFRAINAAAAADLDPATAAQRIRDAIEWLSSRTDRWRWLIGPSSRPGDLGERLIAAGLEQVSDSAGMALDLREWRTGAPLPARVTTELVTDEVGLERWRDVQERGLGLDAASAEAWWSAHRRLGIEAWPPLRNWIAYLDGEPVAAAALFVGAGVAGIYNVCTVPEARGRGIGSAVTAVAIDAAVADGHDLAVLGASDMGFPVYRRLGFREVSRLRSYAAPAGVRFRS